jgi:hypothetical protein
VFREFVVDIDFPNQRVNFYRPDAFTPPAGVSPLVFKQDGESRAVSVSVEDGPPMSFWVYLGDPGAISVHQRYSMSHGMLQGRINSIRMGGGPRTPPEAVATVREVKVAGIEFNQVPGVFPDDSVTGAYPADVSGHIGLALLSRCRVIFDYGRDRYFSCFAPGSSPVAKRP